MFSLVANTIQKHRWFFNYKSTSEGWYITLHYARSLENKNDSYKLIQVIIEPKGENLIINDKWKEDFLKEINSKVIYENTDYKIIGFEFTNFNGTSAECERRRELFKKNVDNLIKSAF